ncbi:30S ribosomal protein S8 [Spiribacter aquaticus]|jgi:small subunit ribosomal protein S8|uniref:Small ribosomal subunit protein uS8 n=2 Tax=Spiribacter TaxID=1335745 RepID=A0A557RGT2_9GAMM|nr:MULTISPECIES: 30S ribosomal protein S8 [Spiribacter]PZA00011.1 30S ribosomal protein S8 [Gammaproteobacteria bacterium 2W06]AUB78945.1 30S ribosomal protein S8 [Spiribacter roseus]KAF0280889.1 30S ribosomal protein S8 [Spiribacter roseus]KAF0281624.1 30S ribosomal protein S8 [Spiribacter roseus]TVO64354.1 30S ribosomal protein S8 [Spiribacter aquaticus]
MSMTDPIADMLTRIRNGQTAEKTEVSMPSSKLKLAIVRVLKDEGYVHDYRVEGTEKKPTLAVTLKYYEGRPVIEEIQRVSRPGLRRFEGRGTLPRVRGGLGTAIISTSQGVMTDRAARDAGHGGEVLCVVF